MIPKNPKIPKIPEIPKIKNKGAFTSQFVTNLRQPSVTLTYGQVLSKR